MVYEDTKLVAEFSFNFKEKKLSSTVPAQISLSVTRVFLNDGVVFGFCKENVVWKDDNECFELYSQFDSMLRDNEEDLSEGGEEDEKCELSEEQKLMMQMGLPVSFSGSELAAATGGPKSRKPKRHGIGEVSCVDKKSWSPKSNVELSTNSVKGIEKSEENGGEREANLTRVTANFKHSMSYCVKNLLAERGSGPETPNNIVIPQTENCPTLHKRNEEERATEEVGIKVIGKYPKDYEYLVQQFTGTFPEFWQIHGSDILKQQMNSAVESESNETELNVAHDQIVKRKRAEMEIYWKFYHYFYECNPSQSLHVNNASSEEYDCSSDIAEEEEVKSEADELVDQASEMLSPEKKFESFQNNMADCLGALRCNWVQREMDASNFKSVHIKLQNNESKRRGQKRRKKNAESLLNENFDFGKSSDVYSEDEPEFSLSSESNGNKVYKKVEREQESPGCELTKKVVEKSDFERKEILDISATNPKTLPGFDSSSQTTTQKTGVPADIPSPHSVACYPVKSFENSGSLDRETVKKLEKYWCQRFRLFSKFDHGCLLDQESWFSITPEKIAQHHADRCRCDVILDGFCGSGGNSIQLGLSCEHVIGVDIDPAKLSIAKHNSNIYGVENRIDFILSDFLLLQPFPVDCVFLSPPWGGPTYTDSEVFDCETMMTPPLSKLMSHAREFSHNIAVLLPKNIDVQQIVNDYTVEGEYVEIEQNFLSNKLKTITVYFNDLVYFE